MTPPVAMLWGWSGFNGTFSTIRLHRAFKKLRLTSARNVSLLENVRKFAKRRHKEHGKTTVHSSTQQSKSEQLKLVYPESVASCDTRPGNELPAYPTAFETRLLDVKQVRGKMQKSEEKILHHDRAVSHTTTDRHSRYTSTAHLPYKMATATTVDKTTSPSPRVYRPHNQ